MTIWQHSVRWTELQAQQVHAYENRPDYGAVFFCGDGFICHKAANGGNAEGREYAEKN
jgi:hypothetical protein